MKKNKNKTPKEKLSRKLSFKLVNIIFSTLLISSLIIGILMYLMSLMKMLIFPDSDSGLVLIISMFLTSIIIGTFLGSMFGYRTLKPIHDLSNATKKIAEGDFKVKIEEIETHDRDSELNDLIQNFNIMAGKLAQIETLRSDFIANVSHEFKTPIATIQGYVTLLSDDKLSNEERCKYINIIYDATKKLTNLTSNILKISKIENQEVQVSKEKYDLAEQIREIIILMQASWEKKNIDFDLDMIECEIDSDEELLQQVWMNIISNAIKFSPQNGLIKINLEESVTEVKVSITDNGIGMSEETVQHIFDKFYQGDESHSKEGNGLGLALTKKIIDLCKGKIIVNSTLGTGTTITVVLPKGNELK